MRVAFLTRYSAQGGSSRIRVFQYFPYLEHAGIDARCLPWNVTSIPRLARYAAHAIRLASWADVVVVQKPCQPPWLIEAVVRVNSHVVVDFDDAGWVSSYSEQDESYGARLRYALRKAQIVTAGSELLAGWAKRVSPAIPVEVLRPSVDLQEYESVERNDSPEPVTIGWIGSAGNLADFDPSVIDALRSLTESGRARLTIVSSAPLDVAALQCSFEPWSPAGEVASLRRFDIGIMPLVDSERSRGRCGFKAIQYMAVGVPVVASAVTGPTEVVDEGVNGFLANSSEEWQARLLQLIEDPALRAKMGTMGRRAVEERFSIQANLPKVLAILERARLARR